MLTTSPPSLSRFSRKCMEASMSQNPMDLHVVLQGELYSLPFLPYTGYADTLKCASSVTPGKCRNITWIGLWPLLFKSLPIYHSTPHNRASGSVANTPLVWVFLTSELGGSEWLPSRLGRFNPREKCSWNQWVLSRCWIKLRMCALQILSRLFRLIFRTIRPEICLDHSGLNALQYYT
jgi:hypothetical protein